VLSVRDLSVRFGGVTAVSHLSFDLRAGIVKGLIGPNGAGKTTVFNAIAGLVPLHTGSVALEGHFLEGLRPHQRAALGMARTFQNQAIYQDLSVLENVMLGAHRRAGRGWMTSLLRAPAVSRQELRLEEEAFTALARVGLETKVDASAGELSFGEGKLLELARILLMEPRLLMLDEPMAGVPRAQQIQFVGLIRSLVAEGVTVLLVEHNMPVVMQLCDEILVLAQGERLAEGTPEQIAANPAVIAAYLGETADA
jgi:branched-chain amino acid transport system ATP-binding protein